MANITKMHRLLEEMIKSTESRDTKTVLDLNARFEESYSIARHELPKQLELEYDNCRLSCVLSVTMSKDYYEMFVSDAKERFSRIPKPYNQ